MPLVNGNSLASGILSKFSGPTSLFQFTGNIYPTDFLDIFIIALFIYSLFYLFRKTRTFLVFVGLFIVIALYAIARIFNLYLTSLALQYFFGISVIMFVIIFQQEIRKYFELVGLIGTRQIKVGALSVKSPSSQEIIQSCIKMAGAKIGCLIVLQGNDSLDLLTEGGIQLDGLISEEALLSIFDPHSEGHDGALVITNNRISKFGAHLPLSNNFKEIGKHGTRHSAALGLAETSDALCIVTSEEHGTISVCHDGKMKTLDSFADLEKEINKFIREKFAPPSAHTFTRIFSHLGLKSAALLSAAVLWFFSAYQAGIIKKTYSVPVNFSRLPSNIQIENYSPKDINLTLSGRGDVIFSQITAGDFQISLDASDIKNGVNQLEIFQSNIVRPLNLTLTSIDPSTILLTAKKYISYKLPISVTTKGTPAKGFQVKNITITPTTLDIWIPENASSPAQIATETIDITGLKDSFVVPARLLIPEGLKLQKPDLVTATIALTIEK